MNDHSFQIPQKSKSNLYIPVLIIITLLSLCFSGFLMYQNNQFNLLNSNQSNSNISTPTIVNYNIISPSPLPEDNKIVPTTLITEEYKITKYGGLFSYEYPIGWHVAELWQQTSNEGVIIAMDPKPISTAPRGGPLATFEIRIINGQPNPGEIFNNEIAKFSDESYFDIKKETINSDLGSIYHYQGKFKTEMVKGEPIEVYYLIFEMNKNDPANQQIIIATMALQNDPKLTEMFRHIVLSIKKLN